MSHVNPGRNPFVQSASNVVPGSAVADHRLLTDDQHRDTFETVATAIFNYTASVVATAATELSATAASHYNNVSFDVTLSHQYALPNAFSTVSSAHLHNAPSAAHSTSSSSQHEYAEMPQIPAYIRTTSMVLCITIMILGVIGNTMVNVNAGIFVRINVIYLYQYLINLCACVCVFMQVPIVIMKTKDMRNSTNIFLTNLSVADLLVLIVCTPTVLIEVNSKPETWVLGRSMCKFGFFAKRV